MWMPRIPAEYERVCGTARAAELASSLSALSAGPAAPQQMAGDERDDDHRGRDQRVVGVAGDVAVYRADVAAGQVAHADPGPRPQRGTERVERQEAQPGHAGDAGHDPVGLASPLDEPGHGDEPGAVAVE